MPKLQADLPCPFCGAHDPVIDAAVDRLSTQWFLQCEACGASGPLTKTADEAIAAWNRRATATEAAA